MEGCANHMMTSSNGNIFRVSGPLCGEFTGPGEFPTQRAVTRSFDVFFDLRLNKRLSKQPWGWWFETPSWSLWRQCNDFCPPKGFENCSWKIKLVMRFTTWLFWWCISVLLNNLNSVGKWLIGMFYLITIITHKEVGSDWCPRINV